MNPKRWRFKDSRNKNFTVAVNGPIHINYGASVASLSEAGLGVAQLPNFLVDASLAKGRLVELLPEYAIDDLYLYLLYHQNGTRNRAIKAIVDYLVECLSKPFSGAR